MKNNLKGTVILIITAFIWGMAFVAQSSAADALSGFTVSFLRSYIACAFLTLFIVIRDKRRKVPIVPKDKKERKKLLLGGLICGTALCVASNLQQFGIGAYPKGVPSEARAGFLTALYVILVPIVSVLFKKKIPITVWIAVFAAVCGVYLLCAPSGSGSIYLGDILLLMCAVGFTVHIITVDTLGSGLDGVKLSALQFFVCGTVSLILMLVFELDTLSINAVFDALPTVIYLGIMSGGIGYTLQIIGQRYATPTVASIAMSFESVFAALGGWLISGNALSTKELIGCAVMFVAIIIAEC